MSTHEFASVQSPLPLRVPDDTTSNSAEITIDGSSGTDDGEVKAETYGRGKRTMQIDYKRLAGETYSYDSSEELMYQSFASDKDTVSTQRNPNKLSNAQSNFEYANKHVPHLLFRTYDFDENTPSKDNTVVQTLHDGAELTVKNLADPGHYLSIHKPILITDTAESIGMKVPRGKTRQRIIKLPSDLSYMKQSDGKNVCKSEKESSPSLPTKKIITTTEPITIREIGEKIGMDHPVSVMDVKTQDEMEGWIISDLVEYFEDEDRLYQIRQYNHNSFNGHSRQTKKFQPLKASKPRVLNQISLEFSNTVLKKDTLSPSFVREIDWIDNMWPANKRYDQKGNDSYPRVQYYCLTSTAECYTDFHIDFGGTSVWYHVLSGKKVFLLIPPTKHNVVLYESWLCSKHQPDIFFPDMKEEVVKNEGDDKEIKTAIKVETCVRVILEQNQTLIIPTGWIHAVYTPVDSLVIGGNFLHGFDIDGQLDIHCLETRTRVPAKFRFPFFVQLQFYAGTQYFKRLVEPCGYLYKEEVKSLPKLIEALRSWSKGPSGDINHLGSVAHVMNECVTELQSYGIRSMEDLLTKLEAQVNRLQGNGCEKKPNLDMKENITANPTDSNCEVAPEKRKLKLSMRCSSLIPNNKSQPAKDPNDAAPGDDVDESISNQLTTSKISSTKSKRLKIGDLSSKRNIVDDDEWLPGGDNEKSKSPKRPKEATQKSRDSVSQGMKNSAGKVRKGDRRNSAVGKERPQVKQKQPSKSVKSRLRKKLGM